MNKLDKRAQTGAKDDQQTRQKCTDQTENRTLWTHSTTSPSGSQRLPWQVCTTNTNYREHQIRMQQTWNEYLPHRSNATRQITAKDLMHTVLAEDKINMLQMFTAKEEQPQNLVSTLYMQQLLNLILHAVYSHSTNYSYQMWIIHIFQIHEQR